MAKIGEGDSRWIVQERQDGTNCNNWHWSQKVITEAATAKLKELLSEAVLFQDDACTCSTTEVTAVKGEIEQTSRKGKVWAGYELELTVGWEATLAGETGLKAKGTVKFPDVSPECLDDLDTEFKCKEKKTPAPPELKDKMRKKGVPALCKLINQWHTDLQTELNAQGPNTPRKSETVLQPQTLNGQTVGVKAESVKPAPAPATAKAPAAHPAGSSSGGGDCTDPKAGCICTIGTVFAGSPADQAGLKMGDSMIQFGPITKVNFHSIQQSIVPVVGENIGSALEVTIIRLFDLQVQQVKLTLRPQKWSGNGLLGCILNPV